jgi:hypothetical protein
MKEGLPFRVFLLASMIFMLIGGGSAYADKRIALIVGNAQYAHINPLKNPGNDAPDLAEALKSIGFEVILRTDAAKNELDRALAEFSRKSVGADVALFYYAGHGVQYQGTNYLLPTDIDVLDINDVVFQALDTNIVRNAFQQANGVKILILDACRDDPFKRTRVARRAIASPGLTRVDATDGMIVVYATSPNQVALDGNERNSPFAEALVQRVREPGVEITAMLRRVAGDVYERTRKEQRPEFTSNVIGDFYLNPFESDRVAWERLRDSTDPNEFRSFIQRFPNSSHLREAQRYIDLFEQIRVANEERRRNEQRATAERLAAEREAQSGPDVASRTANPSGDSTKPARIEGNDRAQAEKLAAQKSLLEQQRLAEAARKEEEHRAAEERQRIAALEQKALLDHKEAERLKTEAENRRVRELCDREGVELKTAVATKQLDLVDAFRQRASCPTIGIAIDREIRDLKRQIASACNADQKALTKLKGEDLASLRDALLRMTCEPVRADAAQRIARLESEQHNRAEVCAKETEDFRKIDGSGLDAEKRYSDFLQNVSCANLRPLVQQAFSRLKKRTKETQTELARLGCYSGPANGRLDETTQKSMSLYSTKKGEIAEPRLTDDFVSGLKNQTLRVCPETTPIANAPSPSAPVQKAKQEEEEAHPAKSPKPKVRRASREEDEAAPAKPVKQRVRRAKYEEQETSAPPPRRRAARVAPAENSPPRWRREPPALARRAPAPAPAPVAMAPRYSAPPAYSGPAYSAAPRSGGGSIHGAGF